MVQEAETFTKEFYIGLFLAISSSIFIGSSFILKKKALIKLGTYSTRAGQGGFGYLREWLWWTGMILMAVGEICNFTAYAFAPATLVTPLGALSVLVSAILASYLLNEYLNLIGKFGCLICILGSTVIIIHSPKEAELKNMMELSLHLKDVAFIIYVFSIVVFNIWFIYFIGPKFGQSNAIIYVLITGSIGSLSVIGCKGLGIALKETFNGSNQLKNPLTWFIIIIIAFCISVQMNYLNKALDIFNTSVVTPMLYVIFTTFVIIASAILFKEWNKMTTADIFGIICGFGTIISGIFLLQAFKDYNLSTLQLMKQLAPKSCPNESSSTIHLLSNEETINDSRNVPVLTT